MQRKIWFFGHFGGANFGNEITLQTILYHLRLRFPDATFACICSGPEALEKTYKIESVPISRRFIKPWPVHSRLVRWLRGLFIGVPSEFLRWFDALRTVKGRDVLIIPGTGLLTDAYGLSGWGPYSLFKWSLVAKLRGCELLFISVGAGPLDSRLGKYFVKSALSLADFRSYRDEATLAYLRSIGFRTNGDRVYPDLVFSFPEKTVPDEKGRRVDGTVVGLGLMMQAAMYSAEKPNNERYQQYLDNLVSFAAWLLARGYRISLLIGDVNDAKVAKEFRSQLRAALGGYDEERISDQPAGCVEELLTQIAATDIVVATRFHNVLLAILLNKPVIAISFHQKCKSLMSDIGLMEYCHDINQMSAERLIEQFQRAESNAEKVKLAIRQRVEKSRSALEEQYSLIFKTL
jgi:polysaccharide pyruvyl transferase WcaK-like protein